MILQTGIIIYFIRLLLINLYVYFGFIKISNAKKIRIRDIILIIIINLVLTSISVYINYNLDFFISILILIILYSAFLCLIAKIKLSYALVINITSYAICIICYGISTVVSYIPYMILYKLYNIENLYINLFMILIIQFWLMHAFFKINRIKNGFDFLQLKLNNDYTDIVIINISMIIILIYCLIGTNYDDITWSLLVAFIILGIITFIMIQKLLTIYYKQKLQNQTLKDYERELDEKKLEIENLKNEKFNFSKITHEFYNRQKALELLVKQNLDTQNNITEENVNKNILNIIKNLTNEFSEEFNKIKILPKLDTTDITEIDTIFKYMQSECDKYNIDFKLKIIGNIYSLINNIIPKNKLETLIGDHLIDAINAVKSIKTDNKEIFAILGIKDNEYELCIYDTGIEFEIETLINLGKKRITTHKETGGSGIGFMTTFSTMNKCKGSIIIEEYNKDNNDYTKAVIFRFDGKGEYKIRSYRAEMIKSENKDNRIVIEKIT